MNQKDSDGRSPLHQAVIAGIKTIHNFHLSILCRLNFHFSVILSTGYKTAIELLIEKGSNVRAVDNKNMTPLHYIALLESSNVGHRNWPEEDTLGKLLFGF